MLRFFKNKILLLVVMMILVLYLSNDFSLIDIKETAIIVSLGIDKDEGDIYEVSAQIAVPQTTEQTASNGGTVITAKGETVALAIENIGVRTGWYPKLSFCNILIFGEGLFEKDVMESIDYFIRTIKIQDTVEVCAAKGKAKDLLSSSSPLDELSTFSVTKVLQKDAESSSSVSYESLREFAMGYYSKSEFSFMPLIKPIETESTEGEGGSQPASKIINTSSSGKEGGSEKKKKIFDATTTLLLSKGKRAGELNAEETLVFNLVKHKVNEASIQVKDTEYYGMRANLFIALRNNQYRLSLKIEDGRPTLYVNLSIVARIDDTNVKVSPNNLASGYVVPDNILRDIEEQLAEKIKSIFETARENNCDIFEVKDKLYRTQNKYYEGFEKLILKECSIKVGVLARSFK